MDCAPVAGPVLRAHGIGLQSVPAVLHTVQRVRWMMMIIVLHTMHRAAQAGSMLQVDPMPGPVAAVQQSTMPGACQELASITWPHTAYASV